MYLSRRGLGQTPAVISLAQAIAYAEGYYAPGSPGTINSPTVAPVRNNNPCDLGGASGSYPSIAAGWNACYGQLDAMVGGTSPYYTPDESLAEIAPTYTGNDNAASWASIVAGQLGVSVDTPLSQIAGGTVVAQNSVDPTTGLPVASTDDSDLSDSLDASVPGGIALTDGSGNLTGWGWGAIAVGVGLVVWVAA